MSSLVISLYDDPPDFKPTAKVIPVVPSGGGFIVLALTPDTSLHLSLIGKSNVVSARHLAAELFRAADELEALLPAETTAPTIEGSDGAR